MTPPKKYNNFSIIDPKEMESCNFSGKEFKIVVWREFSELQENRQFNKIRKTIHEQNEKFNREMEIERAKFWSWIWMNEIF